MGSYSLFQMWEPHRQSLITGHLFYVEQARKRLLSQFEDIEGEADKAAECWLEANSGRFNPDFHDIDDFYEAAHDERVEYYQLLSDMRDRTRLSVIAGMYHEWDKQLHQWMVGQMRGWCSGDEFEKIVWKISLTDLADLVEPLDWAIRSKPYFAQLDASRLIVNVYKHGNGPSLEHLKCKYPEYLHNPVSSLVGKTFLDTLSHEHLAVSDDQLQAFSEAIEAFWRDVPENIYDHDSACVPAWLNKALGDGKQGASAK